MSPQPQRRDELLPILRRARLLDAEQERRLSADWPADLPAAECVRRLVEAGLLTAFQAEQVLAGRAHRLRLGPYRLLDRLGGRGPVFKAEHVLLKRLVTLKVLGKRQGDEVATVAGLCHPNLVAAQHATRLRGRLVLVLDYFEGVDLEQFLRQTGPLPIALVREVARQAAAALAHLHGRGLVHRDVKPANLVLGGTRFSEPRLNEAWQVKLIDLGLACRAGTLAREVCGTVDYLAPERGTAHDRADVRGDLYGLGCTLYHLLTGQVPHAGDSWTEKLLRHRLEEPAPLPSLRPDVPADLAEVVHRLMARDPADRYPDPQALLDALDRPPRPAPPGPRRPRLLRVLAVALCSTALGAAARLGWPELPAQEATPAPARRTNPFVTVAGREGTFSDLEKAIEGAPDGATLVLHGRGPHPVRPMIVEGKRLTLRGAGGEVPRLVRRETPGGQWEALLASDRDLVLEGLELSAGSAAESVTPLVAVTQGRLVLRDCRLEGSTRGPLVALRRGTRLRLERCQIDARAQAVAVEQAAGRAVNVRLSDSRVRVRDEKGAAILVWAAERAAAPPGALDLERCQVEAGRVLACRCLGGRLRVRTSGCGFVFRQALLSVDACPARPGLLSWQARQDCYQAGGAWLRRDGRAELWDEDAWRRLGPGGS